MTYMFAFPGLAISTAAAQRNAYSIMYSNTRKILQNRHEWYLIIYV